MDSSLRRFLFTRLLALGAAVLAALLPMQLRAADLVVILSDRGQANSEFLEAFQQSLEGSGWQVRGAFTADTLSANDTAIRQADLWISVGSEGTRAAAARYGPPLLATLVPQSVFEQLANEYRAIRQKSAFSAIVLDQPAGRQMQFIRNVLPRRTKMALLGSADSAKAMARLEASAQSHGFEVFSETVSDDLAVVPTLSKLLGKADFLLALPDPLVFGRNSIRPVLLTSYRYQRPVIAFSPAFVTAGALAAVYSTPRQIARQTGEFLAGFNARRALPNPMMPQYFAVSVNRQVASSLALDIPEDAVIQRVLETGRNDP